MEALRRSSILRGPLRVPRHLPEMTVGVLKIPSVPAPKRLLGWLDDDGASVPRLLHDRIDLCLGRHIVPERELRWTCRPQRQPRVVGDAPARPEREPYPGLQLDEDHGSIGKLPADDPLGCEAKAAAIEAQGSFQIIDPDGDNGDARLHRVALLQAERQHGATPAVRGVPLGTWRGPPACAPVMV